MGEREISACEYRATASSLSRVSTRFVCGTRWELGGPRGAKTELHELMLDMCGSDGRWVEVVEMMVMTKGDQENKNIDGDAPLRDRCRHAR